MIGSVGLDHGNLTLLHGAASVWYALRKPYVILADWNNPPDVLAASGWLQSIGGAISASERPTCLVRGARKVYDYAVHSHHWSVAPKG